MGTGKVLGSLGGNVRCRDWLRGKEGLLGEKVNGFFSQVEGPRASCRGAVPLS